MPRFLWLLWVGPLLSACKGIPVHDYAAELQVSHPQCAFDPGAPTISSVPPVGAMQAPGMRMRDRHLDVEIALNSLYTFFTVNNLTTDTVTLQFDQAEERHGATAWGPLRLRSLGINGRFLRGQTTEELTVQVLPGATTELSLAHASPRAFAPVDWRLPVLASSQRCVYQFSVTPTRSSTRKAHY